MTANGREINMIVEASRVASEPNVPEWAMEKARQARAEALEEAAKVAEGWDQIHGGPARLPAAIRALKSPGQDD